MALPTAINWLNNIEIITDNSIPIDEIVMAQPMTGATDEEWAKHCAKIINIGPEVSESGKGQLAWDWGLCQ